MKWALSVFCIFMTIKTNAQSVYFQFSDGSTATYASSTVSKITHAGSNLNLIFTDGSSVVYNKENIVYFNYESAPKIILSMNALADYDSLCISSASSPLSYTLKGYQLSENVVVTAPAGFEISTSSNSGYASSITLIPNTGSLDLTIYARFLPDVSGTISGLITHTSAGAVSRDVAVSGYGIESGTWIGAGLTNNWGEAANWCGGVPSATTDVVIPKDTSVQINNASNARNLILSGTLYGGTSTLNLKGSLYIQGDGSFLPQTGTLAFTGASDDQFIENFGIATFRNITVNKSAGRFIFLSDITIDNNFTITNGDVIVNPFARLTLNGSGNFNGQSVTLKSDASGTASIGPIANNGANLSGATNVTVERYIPANQKWRGLSVPLSSSSLGSSIYKHWQNNGTVRSGEGVLLWSPNSESGFSLNTNSGASQNIRKYNGASGFATLSGTTSELLFNSGKPIPYLVFATDFYKKGTNVGNMASGAAETRLRSTGTLFTGDYNSGTLATGFHMIPNPYPSAIAFENGTIGGNLDNQCWIWDPLLDGFRGYGGYQTFSGGVITPGGGSYSYTGNTPIIPHGGAFWVYSNGNGSISFNESAKTFADFNVFGRTNNKNQLIRVNLMNGAGDRLLDGVAAAFNDNASAGIDKLDARKFGLAAENIFISRNNLNLAIEFRPAVLNGDTIYLGLNQLNKQPYSLKISGTDFDRNINTIPVLQDLYLNQETVLDLYDTTKINFVVNDQVASSGNRFRIVFRTNTTTPVPSLESDKGVYMFPNPVAKGGIMQISLINKPAGSYRLILYNGTGVLMMNQLFTHGGGTSVQSITLPDTISAGIYIAELSDSNGKSQQIKLTIQ
jgi:hypothetical protein